MNIDAFKFVIDPLPEPENAEQLELYTGWFFGRIKQIVSVENHIMKWRDVTHILTLLGEAAEYLGLNITFTYSMGYWSLECDPDDFLQLPSVAKLFGRLYRFQRGHDNKIKEKVHAGSNKKICGI